MFAFASTFAPCEWALKVYSHLRVIWRKLFCYRFSPHNDKEWVQSPFLNFSVQAKIDQIASVNAPISYCTTHYLESGSRNSSCLTNCRCEWTLRVFLQKNVNMSLRFYSPIHFHLRRVRCTVRHFTWVTKGSGNFSRVWWGWECAKWSRVQRPKECVFEYDSRFVDRELLNVRKQKEKRKTAMSKQVNMG